MERFLKLPRFAFTRAALEHAPEEPGVYALFHGEEMIYLGRASTREHSIRRCLLEHQDGARGACTMKATRYTWEISVWPAAREAELLKQFRREHRRDPRCNAEAA